MALPALHATPTDRQRASPTAAWPRARLAGVGVGLLQLALGAAAMSLAGRLPHEPPAAQNFQIVFAPAPASIPVAVAEPVAIPRSSPMPIADALHVLPIWHSTPTLPRPPARPEQAARPGNAAPPVAQTPPPTPTREAAAPPAPDTKRDVAQLTQRIDNAVQRAAEMPEAARRLRREGRAQVRFDYRDGGVDTVALAAPSGFGLFDSAAMQAVRTARYPVPPPDLEGRTLRLLVWVDFRLISTD